MVRIGLVVVLALGVAGSVDAEQLPSLFSGKRSAGASAEEPSLGEHRLAPSALPAGPRNFLLGPRASAQGPVVAPSLKAEADGGAGGGITPRRAFLYSVLVPGLGEWMAGAKKRAMVFFGVEAVALGLWTTWKGKGNDVEDEFRAVADENWDPLGYIVWRDSRNARNSSITHALPCSSYVDAYLETGQFTGCDDTEIQQYYELIGKYDQFVAGWGDLVRVRDGNRVEPTDVDSVENFLSDLRLSYEDQRDESNRFLKRASTVTGLILINHVFSAIDAARVARARSQGVDEAALRRRTRVAMVMRPWERGQVPMLMAYKPFY